MHLDHLRERKKLKHRHPTFTRVSWVMINPDGAGAGAGAVAQLRIARADEIRIRRGGGTIASTAFTIVSAACSKSV